MGEEVQPVTRGGRARRIIRGLGPALLIAATTVVPVGGAGLGLSAAVGAGDPVVAAAGDIACDPANGHFFGGNGDASTCRQKATSDLLVNGGYSAVLSLGDNQYYCGGYSAFLQAYDPSWGRLKSVTHPVVGNHEYLTSGGTGCDPSNAAAAGYFKYFGSAAGQPGKGYYSFNVGAWHLIALNSNCGDIGGCSSGSPEYSWLASDLAAHPNFCTLAYWHIPLFSSGGRAASNMRSIWKLLYDNGTDVVLSGHDHIYERFAPQTSTGVLDNARGIREFIIGTGGANHTAIESVAANSQLRNATTYGIFKLTLHSTSYDWKFVPESGKTFTDSGTGQCHAGAAGALTFTPTADAYIRQDQASTNFGRGTSVQVDGSPQTRSLFSFSVSGVGTSGVASAKLRVYATEGSTSGGGVRSVTGSWSESSVTWGTSPTFGSTNVSTHGAVTAGQWIEYDVTSLVKGNGTVSMGIVSGNGDGASYVSREGTTSQRPQLVVTPNG
jgi:acid phosphatase type 7